MTADKTPVSPRLAIRDVFLFVAALVLVFSLYPLAGILLPGKYYGMATDRPAPAFSLSNSRGLTVSNADYHGKYLYLMFGYLKCRDVCHSQVLLLSSLAGLIDDSDTAFAFLAMDSSDSSAVLEAYFDNQGDNFISLRAASQQRMHRLASAFGAGFTLDIAADGDNYSINHPARIFLIDPKGRLRMIYRGAVLDATRIAADFHQLEKTRQSAFRKTT